jgi:hypothetical protein
LLEEKHPASAKEDDLKTENSGLEKGLGKNLIWKSCS